MEENPIFTFTIRPIPDMKYHFVNSSIMVYADRPSEPTVDPATRIKRMLCMTFEPVTTDEGTSMKVTYIETVGDKDKVDSWEIRLIPADEFNQEIAFDDFVIQRR